MDVDSFWVLIEETHQMSNGVMEHQLQLLLNRLLKLDVTEIVEFDRIFTEMRRVSCRANLWDALQIIYCGCSESCFDEFRGWLIGQGRIIFHSALNDPESLANIIQPNVREDVLDGRLIDVAQAAYEQKAGRKMPLSSYNQPLKLIGERAEAKELPQKYPTLFAKFSDCEK